MEVLSQIMSNVGLSAVAFVIVVNYMGLWVVILRLRNKDIDCTLDREFIHTKL